MVLKIVYTDGTTWSGTPETWKNSPDKAILIVGMAFEPPYRTFFLGDQTYGAKLTGDIFEFAGWSDYEPHYSHLYVNLLTGERWSKRELYEKAPTNFIERTGDWVTDEVMKDEHAESLTWWR